MDLEPLAKFTQTVLIAASILLFAVGVFVGWWIWG